MIVKLLTEHHLKFLGLKDLKGCQGSSESTLVKMANCWKSHVGAQLYHSVFTGNVRRMVVIDMRQAGVQNE